MRAALTVALIFVTLELTLAGGIVKPPPKKCGIYEVYSECGNNFCQNTCANPNIAPLCKGTCISGCICKDGYLRNSKGVCVRPKQCDTCKENEEFSECDNHGCRNTCAEPDLITRCTYAAGCYPGCICKEGYLRNEEGVCVPENECVKTPQCTGVNEEYSECGNNGCQNTCANPNIAMVCKAACQSGCICEEGFLRNSEGVCVKPELCVKIPQCTGVNEEYSECGNNACQNTCANPNIAPVCFAGCQSGCICKKGFLRNSKGVCVKSELCVKIPQCTGVNEEYSECGNNACQNTCANPNIAPVCKAGCQSGCICKEGFLRNSKGVCVKPELCDTCKANEVFSKCENNGCQNTCENPTLNQVCDPIPGCFPGCICIKGYLKNDKGECVAPKDCGIKCPVNEVLVECANPCPPETCSTINIAFRCAGVDPKDCKPACKCILNHKRDENGRCVHISECPAMLECGANEEYDACPEPCHDDTCTKVDSIGCDSGSPGDVYVCYPKCRCNDGFLRNATRKCIPAEHCESNENCGGDPNAIYTSCGDPCPVTCMNKDDNPRRECPDYCLPGGGCKCKPGYVLNIFNKCILMEKCPKCGKNEFWNCGSACDTTCATLGKVCPIVNVKCNEKCYCRRGFARNSKNECIPTEQCPEFTKKVCPANQIFVDCPGSCPPEKTCESYMSRVAYSCARTLETEPCLAKCICKPGFLRRVKNGECITINQCCNDPNAEVVDCPYPCGGGTCERPEISPCKKGCVVMGCRCKKGYVKDKSGKCILLSECPSKLVCKANEELDPCPPSCPPERTCDQHISGFEYDCAPPPDDFVCVPSCRCTGGYVRNSKGICVAPESCCDDPNAEVIECPDPCPMTCDNMDTHNNFPCGKPCELRGCACKHGHVKGRNGKCIPIEQCPPKKCNKNEKWVPCPPYCSFDKTCQMLIEGIIPDCASPPPNPPCLPRCMCLEGYVRINGTCVPESDCCIEEANTQLTQCPTTCEDTCETEFDNSCQMENCVFKVCKCKPKYRRHMNKCIPLSECPTVCKGKNQEYQSCGTACPKNCENMNKIISCTKQCVPGCFCKKGFVDHNGVCIPPEKCPVCKEANTEYKYCGSLCEKSCENKDKSISCAAVCVPGCFCKKGFILKEGKCVKPEDCKCGDNETWSNTASDCQANCKNYKSKVARCKTSKPGCICLPDYVRECDGGKCIKYRDCKY